MVKYLQIVEILKKEIFSEKYKNGDVFPGVLAIGERFGVSHLTAVKIIKCLEGMHLVESLRGIGTFVAKETRQLVFLSPDFGAAVFFSIILDEISELCQKNNITLKICEVPYGDSKDFAKRFMDEAQKVIALNPKGVIYVPAANVTRNIDYISPSKDIDRQIIKALDDAKIPVTLIDSGIESPIEESHDLIGVNNIGIGMKLANHLAEKGAKRLLFVSWMSKSPNIQERLDGAKIVATEKDLHFQAWLLTKANLKEFRILLQSAERPDAIIASSDRVALMILHILKKKNISVPDEIMLCGVDNTELAGAAIPTLTSIHQPYHEIARVACETLLNRISRPKTSPRHITIATTLIQRQSTSRA